jgi:hypothetical protein
VSTEKIDKSQLDAVQQHRTAYQPESNSHRVDAINVDYNSTTYTYNVDGSVDTIQYLYDSECEVTKVVAIDDVSSSLDATSFNIFAGKDSLQYIIWYNVGSGTPAPSDTGIIRYIETAILPNDPAAVIVLATNNAILAHVTGSVDLVPEVLGTTLTVTAVLRGATTDSSDVDTGFAVTTVTQGATDIVDTARITYDADGNILTIITDSGENIVDEPVKNIRNLTHSRDSIRPGDGTNFQASTLIGPDTLLNIKQAEDPTYYTLTQTLGASTFEGKTHDLDAATSSAVWQISRTTISGNLVLKQYANDVITYDQIWDNKEALFPDPPFLNTFSVQFGGVNEFIDVDHDVTQSFDFRTEAASWVFWCKTSASAPTGVTFFEKQGGTNPGWRVYLANNRMTVELKGTGGVSDRIRVRAPALPEFDDGFWHMMSFTYNGSGLASGVTIYTDGVVVIGLDVQNDALLTDTSTAVNMGIGGRTGGGNTFGPGNVDEVSLHNVLLTSGEISSMYNAGFPIDLQDQGVSPITTNLKYWNRMGDGLNDVFPILEDVEGGIQGTMTNMTAGDIETEVPNG